MKFIITYILTYTNRDATNKISIKNCKSEKHCKERFFKWANEKFKNALNIKIESIWKPPDVNANKEDIFKAFNDILGLKNLNFK